MRPKRRCPMPMRWRALAEVATPLPKPMPDADEMACHRVGGGAVVEADARVRARAVDTPGQDIRTLELREEREELGLVVEPDEHQRVDAALEKLLRQPHLGFEVVVVRG